MSDEIQIGDRVQVQFNVNTWGVEGWFTGTVVRIDPYSQHRSFYWVELDDDITLSRGVKTISVLNPKHLRKNDDVSDTTST